MSDNFSQVAILRVTDLSQRRPTEFDLRPDAETRAHLSGELGVSEIRKLSFRGKIRADGKTDWRLDATLGATVIQPCVVTLNQVTTRIDMPVVRRFVAGLSQDEPEDEVEMPEDDSQEPLGSEINLNQVMSEALALALPDYPRSEGAALEQTIFADPGVAPMTDDDTKPFAALSSFKEKLQKPN